MAHCVLVSALRMQPARHDDLTNQEHVHHLERSDTPQAKNPWIRKHARLFQLAFGGEEHTVGEVFTAGICLEEMVLGVFAFRSSLWMAGKSFRCRSSGDKRRY